MHKILLSSFILIFSFISSVFAAEERNDYAFYLISCGNYIEHRTQKDEAHLAEDMYYTVGWLSAYNHLATVTGNVAENTDTSGVMLWLEKYCRDNPLSNIEAGLFHMTEELNQKNPHPPQAPSSAPAQHPKPSKQLPVPSFPEIPN